MFLPALAGALHAKKSGGWREFIQRQPPPGYYHRACLLATIAGGNIEDDRGCEHYRPDNILIG
jgi:hypothetical protein